MASTVDPYTVDPSMYEVTALNCSRLRSPLTSELVMPVPQMAAEMDRVPMLFLFNVQKEESGHPNLTERTASSRVQLLVLDR